MRLQALLVSALLAMPSSVGCSGTGEEMPPRYRDVQVPRSRLQSPEARERGRDLFLEHCVLCHGEDGSGRGARYHALSTRPQDFTDPRWRRQTSPRKNFHVIREGRPGTSMPGWKILDESETWDLVAYVRSLSEDGSG